MALSISDAHPLPHKGAVAISWYHARESTQDHTWYPVISQEHTNPHIVGLRSENIRETLLSGDARGRELTS